MGLTDSGVNTGGSVIGFQAAEVSALLGSPCSPLLSLALALLPGAHSEGRMGVGSPIPGQSSFSSPQRLHLIHCQTLQRTSTEDNGKGWGGSGIQVQMQDVGGWECMWERAAGFPQGTGRRNKEHIQPPPLLINPLLKAAPLPTSPSPAKDSGGE